MQALDFLDEEGEAIEDEEVGEERVAGARRLTR